MKKILPFALLLLLAGCACPVEDGERHQTLTMDGKVYPFEDVDAVMKDAKWHYEPKPEPFLAWPWAEQ